MRTGNNLIPSILSVAYPFAPVSLDATGGAEQILALLDRGITAAGHHSVVLAAEGSCVSGTLISCPIPPGPIDEPMRQCVHSIWRNAIAETLRRHPIDLIHFHGVDFHRYLPAAGTPVLATLHLPPSFYPESVFSLERPRTWLNCVSASQRNCCPLSPLVAGVVENGVPHELFDTPATPASGYVVSLGRICPEKGFHLALDAADRAGVPLHLAGKLYPYPDHVRYWRTELQPRLRPPHRFLGPIGMQRKPALLAAARCLLAPSLVAETSSLVAMEALACGTPVVAFAAGALPEIVAHRQTGFVVRDSLEMAEAIRQADGLDRQSCRFEARRRFSCETMVARYLDLYARLLRL